jgi:hypothetical protein
MTLKTIVRYMIPCDDWGTDPNDLHCVRIFGLLSNIHSHEMPPYPLYRDLCVFLALTEGRGVGYGQIVCVLEEIDENNVRDSETSDCFRTRSSRRGRDPVPHSSLSISRTRDVSAPVLVL